MAVEKQEILKESSTPVFLDTPKFIEGFGSYYPEALEYKGEKYVIHEKPNELFYKNGKYLVNVVKIKEGEYGKDREYRDMIFDNGEITPFIHNISINNYAELNKKHPIIDTESHGYMKYDENLVCTPLKGVPEGYRATRWNRDEGIMKVEKEDTPSIICTIDKNYKVTPIKGTPEGGVINEIKDSIATIYFEKNEEKEKYEHYFYNKKSKQVEPFQFKGFEGCEYKVDAYNAEGNVISIVTQEGKRVYFYFSGKAQVQEIIHSLVEGKISQLNKDSQTARMYNLNGERAEGFNFYTKGVIKPFTGLGEGETIGYDETYQFINERSKVRALVIKDKNHKEQCRTYDENGKIMPFTGLKEGRKPGNRIRQSVNGNFFFLPIKIPGFGDETHTLLSKDSQKIIMYKDMLITGIDPKNKTIIIVTKAGPDCTITLSDQERNTLIKEWDPTYEGKTDKKSITEETQNKLIANIQ